MRPIEIAALIAVSVLGVALAVCCLMAAAVMAWVVVHYQKSLSLPSEFASRMWADAREYHLRATADAVSAGRVSPDISVERAQTTGRGPLTPVLKDMQEELERLGG